MTQNCIQKVARALARAYALGWKNHAEHVGESPAHLTPDQWAEANADAFLAEATAALAPEQRPKGLTLVEVFAREEAAKRAKD